MNKLSDLNYTLKIISKELHISSTQINNYLDSYVTLPAMSLPECLGIDEIHNPEMSYYPEDHDFSEKQIPKTIWQS